MFLLILESIGTPELILIAVVALIVFGPRKLPQMAKTLAKTMAEFKNATNEFKSTWEKEISFEEEIKTIKKEITVINEPITTDNSISKTTVLEVTTEKTMTPPEIKELSAEDAARSFQKRISTEKVVLLKEENEKPGGDKHDWL